MADDQYATRKWYQNPVLMVPAVVALLVAFIGISDKLIGWANSKDDPAVPGPSVTTVTILPPAPVTVAPAPTDESNSMIISFTGYRLSLDGRRLETLPGSSFSGAGSIALIGDVSDLEDDRFATVNVLSLDHKWRYLPRQDHQVQQDKFSFYIIIPAGSLRPGQYVLHITGLQTGQYSTREFRIV